MARFKKLSLDEARESFTLLSEAERRAIKGGCASCDEARRYGYDVYTRAQFEALLDAGKWTGGYVCGMGDVIGEVTVESDSSYSTISYGKQCFLHNLYYPFNGSCPDCDAEDTGSSSYGSSDYGSSSYGGSSYGSPGGGGGGSILPTVEMMNTAKFVSESTAGNCWKASQQILGKYGLSDTGGSGHVYQLLMEDSTGALYKYGDNPTDNFQKAVACINRHLDNDRPIIVGVNHTSQKGINEGATDHFLVITGRGYDSSKKMYYYTYMETGRSTENAAGACNTTENRFYCDMNKQTLIDEVTYRQKSIIVTQVRPNDGIDYDETIAQPPKPQYN